MEPITDDYYGLTKRDIEPAKQISVVARRLGIPHTEVTRGNRRWRGPGDRRIRAGVVGLADA